MCKSLLILITSSFTDAMSRLSLCIILPHLLSFLTAYLDLLQIYFLTMFGNYLPNIVFGKKSASCGNVATKIIINNVIKRKGKLCPIISKYGRRNITCAVN